MADERLATVWDLIELWYGRRLKTNRVFSDFTVTTSAQRICTANPARVQLLITNWGSSIVAFGENRNITASTGLPLGPGSLAEIDWLNDLDVQATEIWAIATGGSNAVHVEELLLA